MRIALLFAATLLGAASAPPQGDWVPLSDGLLDQIEKQGLKPAWPGKTTGVFVDRATGEAFVAVPGLGLWKTADRGATFARADGGAVGGRCETGYVLVGDPEGRRFACFMLDGPSAMTLDGGKTWAPVKNVGRGWDWGAVLWTAGEPKVLFARTHENRDIAMISRDGGKTWQDLGQGFGAVGIFSEDVLVASRGKEPKWAGLHRSADGGKTWEQVSEASPVGVLTVFKGTGWWLTDRGILRSRDQGRTWEPAGDLAGAVWGPYFGKDENHFVVVDRKGFQETSDGGKTWRAIAPFPPAFAKDFNTRGWFLNFAWDPIGKVCYAARMGQPAWKFAY